MRETEVPSLGVAAFLNLRADISAGIGIRFLFARGALVSAFYLLPRNRTARHPAFLLDRPEQCGGGVLDVRLLARFGRARQPLCGCAPMGLL